jgi:hypothetical protein
MQQLNEQQTKQQYRTVGTATKSNRKIVETEAK